jgi:xylulokinase
MRYLIGIDVSTTAVKALLIDATGAVAGIASAETPLQIPQPLWIEQDPLDWWRGAQTSVRRLLMDTAVGAGAIAAIGLTGQMHGLTVLDEAGKVLRPAILWSDQRTRSECEEIRQRLGRARLIALTGNDALTGFTAPKILWLRQHEPELYARARQFLLPKDYVRYRLTGEYATDRADGAGTLLFDIRARDWSPEVLAALDIDRSLLPPTFEGPTVTGVVSSEAAAATGLRAGTPVVAGGGDQAAQAVGVGAVHGDIAALTLGTGAVIFVATNAPLFEPEGRLHAFCHAVPGRWHVMGVTLSAGGSLRWWRDLLSADTDFDALLAPAAAIPPGSDGLLFLPYLSGERTPHGDPLARGAFVGLTLAHGPAHLTRAILEGVACGVRDSLTLMRDVGLPPSREVRVSGGGARSALWRQIHADLLGVELTTVNVVEGAAFGAALLAGVGTGVWPDVDAACAATVRVTGTTMPRPEVSAIYDAHYSLYRCLYPALRPLMHDLSRADAYESGPGEPNGRVIS